MLSSTWVKFCSGGGGSRNGGFRKGGNICYETGLGRFEMEDRFLVALESDVSQSKYTQMNKCQWTSL